MGRTLGATTAKKRDRDAQILNARFLEKITLREIAERFGVSTATVSKAIRDSLKNKRFSKQ
jgi:DNA-directed RNA polymerase specialized sigma subunit